MNFIDCVESQLRDDLAKCFQKKVPCACGKMKKSDCRGISLPVIQFEPTVRLMYALDPPLSPFKWEAEKSPTVEVKTLFVSHRMEATATCQGICNVCKMKHTAQARVVFSPAQQP